MLIGYSLSSQSLTITRKEGLASFYADKLHGRPTASGEKYDRTKLTAAHPSLPFGTKLKVVNLTNQKSVVVRINDRGPHNNKRIIDISRKAAEQIDMIRAGQLKVRIALLQDSATGNKDEFDLEGGNFDFDKELEKIEQDTLQKKAPDPAKKSSDGIPKVEPLDFSILDENGQEIGKDSFTNSDSTSKPQNNQSKTGSPSKSKTPLQADFDNIQDEFANLENDFLKKEVEPVTKEEKSTPTKPTPGQKITNSSHVDYMIQVNSYVNPKIANQFADKIRDIGFFPVFIQPIRIKQKIFYRVLILQYHTIEEVKNDILRLKKKGYSPIYKKYTFTAK